MSIEGATEFLDRVASPTFERDHANASAALGAAAKANDPDAAAAVAARTFNLHFTGEELKHAGTEVRDAIHRAEGARSAHGRPLTANFGPGGGPTIGLPFPGAIAFKVMLKTLADQLQAEGKSPAEIQAALEAYAGGFQGPDGQPMDLHANYTGVGPIDDVISNTVSVVAGTVQGIAETFQGIADKVFSGW